MLNDRLQSQHDLVLPRRHHQRRHPHLHLLLLLPEQPRQHRVVEEVPHPGADGAVPVGYRLVAALARALPAQQDHRDGLRRRRQLPHPGLLLRSLPQLLQPHLHAQGRCRRSSGQEAEEGRVKKQKEEARATHDSCTIAPSFLLLLLSPPLIILLYSATQFWSIVILSPSLF